LGSEEVGADNTDPLEQENAMTDMTTTRPQDTAHVFETPSGKFYLIDSNGVRVTESMFAQHHRTMTGHVNKLANKTFGYELLTCALESVTASETDEIDPNTMSTDDLEKAIWCARADEHSGPEARAWSDRAAEILAARRMLEGVKS
jgi:hypothetical protein